MVNGLLEKNEGHHHGHVVIEHKKRIHVIFV